jgi:sulfatase maturation enzyme AslB (radical SAM superfamily)
MSDFNVIEENLIKFSSIFHKKINFNCTINWYNIWEIEEFFKYADDINIPVSVQFVTAPVHLNIINLPIKIKKLINEKYKSSTDERIKLIVNRLNLPGKDLSFNFFNHVKHYDKLRNNSFTDVFSEWSRILLNEK